MGLSLQATDGIGKSTWLICSCQSWLSGSDRRHFVAFASDSLRYFQGPGGVFRGRVPG